MRRSVEGKLALLKLQDSFDAIVTGDDVSNHKPAPDIYLKAASLLGVDPNDCIVIEDNEIGVEAARNAGARVVGFGKYNENPQASFGADIHVADWPELSYKMLEKLLK